MTPPILYLDPGTGSILVQLIIGGMAAISAVLVALWRRFFRRGNKQEKDDE